MKQRDELSQRFHFNGSEFKQRNERSQRSDFKGSEVK